MALKIKEELFSERYTDNLYKSSPHHLFPTSNRQVFLRKLLGKNKKYKRYLGSPLRYAGGKSWAVGYVIEKLPGDIKRVVSPFFGGGSIEVAIAKEMGIEVIGFEIFDIF
ncbi:MAG: DNA adenine methylase [Candidatus Ratteibacteria bacterium]|nr:DNA adenine methylase [Candidatus Ratteibacteria bacterium]